MEGTELLLNSPVLPPSPMRTTSGVTLEKDRTERLARDFESVLLTKLVDEMKETIGKGLEEEDATSGQVQGLFWLYLAQDIADKGGLGLWKDLQRFFTDLQNKAGAACCSPENVKTVDEKI